MEQKEAKTGEVDWEKLLENRSWHPWIMQWWLVGMCRT